MTGLQLFGVNRDGCRMWGRKMLTLSGTHNFTPFGEFMISPIHYIYIIYTECVSLRTTLRLQINDFGLFVWICLTSSSRTYFILWWWFYCLVLTKDVCVMGLSEILKHVFLVRVLWIMSSHRDGVIDYIRYSLYIFITEWVI